jgi:thioredoxin reductase
MIAHLRSASVRLRLLIVVLGTASVWSMAGLGGRASEPLSAGAPQATPDENWKPEKITNLKVLPKDITPDQLVTVMKGFAESLNVECIFCHVGKIKDPLSAYDFASDNKEHKEVARNMIVMTNDINSKYPEGMGDDSSVENPKVTCATCHRRDRTPETELPPKQDTKQ